MKKKVVPLFLLSCVLLYVSELLAGALIALCLIYQMNLLFNQIPLTKQSQLAAFKLFLFSIPLFFFLGGIHSFISLYFNESQWLFMLFAMIISFFLFFLANFFCLFVFKFLVKSRFNISATYQAAFQQIENTKKDLLLQTFFLFIISLIPSLTSEWKIIFSLTATQLYYHRSQLKLVYGF